MEEKDCLLRQKLVALQNFSPTAWPCHVLMMGQNTQHDIEGLPKDLLFPKT